MGRGTYPLQLIKFWLSHVLGKGVCGGAKFFGSAFLQPARNVCVSLSAFYAALLPRRGPHIASHSVCLSVPLSLPSVTWRHLANYNDTHVLCGRRRGPHIVRPSRPHKLVFILPMLSVIQYLRMFLANFFHYVIGADRAQCECPQIFSGPLEARTRDKMHDAPLHMRGKFAGSTTAPVGDRNANAQPVCDS